jgi:predicted nucleic acid-binding protein
MYLIDTNIFLEILLDQEKADDAERLLKTLQGKMWISDFSLFSIGIILFRRKEPTKLRAFLDDLKRGGFRLVRVDFDDMPHLVEVSQRFRLDFDDAYQYVVAEKYNLSIVSFDGDFDRTDRRRITPDDLLKGKGL